MEDFAMPLHEFINHPVAEDIIHNGAIFQVAGLTNNSYVAESHEVRHCVQKYKILGKYVLQVAKKRLDDMLYVGLTEEHKESATMFANVVGAQVISQLRAPNTSMFSVDTGHSSLSNSEPDKYEHQNSTLDNRTSEAASNEATEPKMTVGDLMEAYEDCISSLWKAQTQRRTMSLKRISPVNFSTESRLQISDAVLQQIRFLNDLDLELYEYARELFSNQHKSTLQKFTVEIWEDRSSMTNWKLLPSVITSVFLLSFLFIVNMRRRRMLKAKT